MDNKNKINARLLHCVITH